MEGNSAKGKYAALIGCTLMLTIVYMSLTSWSVAVNELSKTFDLSAPLIQAGTSMQIAGYVIGGFIEGKLKSFHRRYRRVYHRVGAYSYRKQLLHHSVAEIRSGLRMHGSAHQSRCQLMVPYKGERSCSRDPAGSYRRRLGFRRIRWRYTHAYNGMEERFLGDRRYIHHRSDNILCYGQSSSSS